MLDLAGSNDAGDATSVRRNKAELALDHGSGLVAIAAVHGAKDLDSQAC